MSTADEGVRQVLENNQAFIRERSILTFKVSIARKVNAHKVSLQITNDVLVDRTRLLKSIPG